TRRKRNPLLLSEQQLAALVAPKTREVFFAFRRLGDMTADQVQAALGTTSKTIYYQIGKLVRAGLLFERGAVRGSHRDRTVYRAVAGNLRMPGGSQGARYERLAARGAGATLRATIRLFEATAERAASEPELVDDLFISAALLRLTPAEIQELKRKLAGLL